MSGRFLVGFAVASFAAASIVTLAPTAQAATVVFADPAGDSGQATDMRRVIVKYAERLKVVVAYPGSSLEGTILHYWVDAARHNPGPEYALQVVPNSEGSPLIKVRGFADRHGTPVQCNGLRASADIFSEKPRTWMSFPATCIGAPGRVRVAVETKNGADHDWAKARRQFLGSVPRN